MGGYNAGDMDSQTVTIAAGGTLSTVAFLGGKRLCGIKMPSTWTASTLSMYSSPNGSGSDSLPVYNGDGGAQRILTVGANQWVEVPPGFGYSVRNMQLKSTVAQVAPATLTLYFREV